MQNDNFRVGIDSLNPFLIRSLVYMLYDVTVYSTKVLIPS